LYGGEIHQIIHSILSRVSKGFVREASNAPQRDLVKGPASESDRRFTEINMRVFTEAKEQYRVMLPRKKKKKKKRKKFASREICSGIRRHSRVNNQATSRRTCRAATEAN